VEAAKIMGDLLKDVLSNERQTENATRITRPPEQESEKMQSLMDELLKSMDTIPSEQRHGPAWEANTNRFLELVERSGDIARKLQLGSDAIKKSETGRKPS
jgi:hypothetical protein